MIAQYGDEHFGIIQSDRYREKLKRRFSVIADTPLLYPAIDHIRKGYRRSMCGVHAIYYRTDSEGVEIMQVLGRQDLDMAL